MRHFFINITLLIFFAFLLSSTFAQETRFNNPVDYGLGRTGAVTLNAWSHFSNPSGISDINEIIAGIGYNRQFNVKELDSKSAIGIIPAKLANFGVGYVYYGFELYNEQLINLSVARNIAPWCKMGMRFNYVSRYQIDSDSYQLITLDAGLQLKPSEKTAFGFYAVNPMAVKWEFPDWEEYEPSFVAAALNYEPVKKVSLEMGVVKNMKLPVKYSFSLNVPLHEFIILRSAIITEPIQLGIGGCFKWKPISLDFAFNHHSVLGFSTSFGLLYSIKSFEKK